MKKGILHLSLAAFVLAAALPAHARLNMLKKYRTAFACAAGGIMLGAFSYARALQSLDGSLDAMSENSSRQIDINAVPYFRLLPNKDELTEQIKAHNKKIKRRDRGFVVVKPKPAESCRTKKFTMTTLRSTIATIKNQLKTRVSY